MLRRFFADRRVFERLSLGFLAAFLVVLAPGYTYPADGCGRLPGYESASHWAPETREDSIPCREEAQGCAANQTGPGQSGGQPRETLVWTDVVVPDTETWRSGWTSLGMPASSHQLRIRSLKVPKNRSIRPFCQGQTGRRVGAGCRVRIPRKLATDSG